MKEIEKAMRDLELWYHPTTLEPDRTNAMESLSVSFSALRKHPPPRLPLHNKDIGVVRPVTLALSKNWAGQIIAETVGKR